MPFARRNGLFRSLRFRLAAWVTLMLFLVVSVTMVAVRQVVLHTLLAEFDQRLLQDMAEVRVAIKKYSPDDERAFAEEMSLRAMAHPHVNWFMQVFDQQGKLLLETPNAPKLAPPHWQAVKDAPAHPLLFDEGSQRVVETSLEESLQRPLLVRLGSTRLSMEDDIALLNFVVALAMGAILVVTPLGAYFLATSAIRPLTRIISTTAGLEPKKLHERLPIRGTGDELDQLSETINGMLDRIGTYIDANRDFVASAAHELRSPLAAIRSSVDVALDRMRSPDEYAALLTDVAEECSRLTSLVNRLLLLAEGDAGRLGKPDKPAPFDKVVRESVNMFEAVAEAKGVELKLLTINPAAVSAEEYHLRQIVRNLLDNAIKFTPAPGRVTVDLHADPAQKRTTLRVSDSGVGIGADDLPRIFERFYRGDKARSRDQSPGGNGLGLAICQSLVTSMDGRIEVQSQPGRGSTFTVTLPLAPYRFRRRL